MSAPITTPPVNLTRKTVLTYLLWGTLFFALVQILAILVIFYAGVLVGRSDLGFFGYTVGAFFGGIYAILIFSPAWVLSTVIAWPFVIACGFAVAAWNRNNDQVSFIGPVILGAVFGALGYLLKSWLESLGLEFFPRTGWDAATADVLAMVFASTMSWRRFRKKNPVTP